MARLTISQKQQRMLIFLHGVRQKSTFLQLRRRGFSLVVWEQGFALLKRTAAVSWRTQVRPSGEGLTALEDLEREHVPVIEATLKAHFPRVFQRVFAGYRRVSGLPLILMMTMLSDRLAAANASSDEEDRAAMQMLADRGVTGDVLAAITAALALAFEVPADDDAPPPDDAAERVEAEAAMWGWFLEWSRIARATIRDRRQLRALGFLRARAGETDPSDGPADPAGLEAPPPAAMPEVAFVRPVPALPAPAAPASTPAPSAPG